MGILFLPKYFGEEYFEIMEDPNRKNQRLFPIMYDLPLTPYGPNDEPFSKEELFERLGLKYNKKKGMEEKEQPESINVDNAKEKYFGPQAKDTDKLHQTTSAPNLSNKKDMKYSGKPVQNAFFPSFKKN